MGSDPVTIEGVVKPDGTLEVTGKVPLPEGKVQVTIVPLAKVPAADPFWQMLHGIWDSRKAAGLHPRSVQEIEAERRAIRAEMEEEIQHAMRLQAECRQVGECAAPGAGVGQGRHPLHGS